MIVRALKEGITPKKVEDRLSRMLSSKGLERDLHDAIAEESDPRTETPPRSRSQIFT
jgi:hypothetical protein